MNLRRYGLLLLCLFVLIGSHPAPLNALQADVEASPPQDLLVYAVRTLSETSIILYNPLTDTTSRILEDFWVGTFILSADSRLAFTAHYDGGSAQLFIADLSTIGGEPFNVSERLDLDGHHYPLGWSRDGRSLAFNVQTTDGTYLYVWDGDSVRDITPDSPGLINHYFDVAWSLQGNLAFTVHYFYGEVYADGSVMPTPSDYSEIYFWDGDEAVNVSQSPATYDHSPVWSDDGRLAFATDDGISVWDGVSRSGNAPETSTFQKLPILPTNVMSFPTWTDDGLLAFEAAPASEIYYQILTWDGQDTVNLSQLPNLHNGFPRWNRKGQWAFATFYSAWQFLYVRDDENRLLLVTPGQAPLEWSHNGYLAYCRRTPSAWQLWLWDGAAIRPVTEGIDIHAQWQGGGTGVSCTSG